MSEHRFEEYFDSEDGERARMAVRSTCPVCLLLPCSEMCPIGFTQEELDSLQDKLLGYKAKNEHQD